MKVRIVGCGNPQRRDDAAGVLVAQRLRELGMQAEVQSGGAFELMSSWDEQEHLVLIDAVETGALVGTVHVWEGRPPRLPSGSQVSSHGFGLAEAFRLGRMLNCLPQQITVYGLEGKDFGWGEEVSAAVLAAVDRVASQIAEEFSAECLPAAEAGQVLN